MNKKNEKMNKRMIAICLSKIIATSILITLSGMSFAFTDNAGLLFGINYFMVILLCLIWE